MAVLNATGLVKSYGRRRVVDGVSFEVHQGEIVGLLGPNGAGKTTSFRMTCGMIEPDAGQVQLNGIDVTNWPMYRRAKEGGMGYLAQESSVFRKLSVQNNLLGMMEMLGVDRKTRKARCKELLEQFNIWHLRKVAPHRCRAASDGDWKSPAAWSPSPGSSCWMSRSPASIRLRSTASRRLSAT